MQNLANTVQLIGNLGQAPELKTFDGGKCLVKLSLATNEYFSSNGEKQQRTSWHNVVAWGKVAENMEKYLNKGDQIVIQGRLAHRNYEDKDGIRRYISEIVASSYHSFKPKAQ